MCFAQTTLFGRSLVLGGVFLTFLGILCNPQPVAAVTLNWTGASGADWNSAANWNLGVTPTSTTDVVINSSTALTITVSSSISFGSLQIGGGSATTTFVLVGNITSGNDITVANKGVLEQRNATNQTIAGTLLVQSGGVAQHTANTSTQAYALMLSANTITIDSGGQLSAESRGYSGVSGADGRGPGAGLYLVLTGSGAGHGGAGGLTSDGIGGSAYCVTSSPATIGSSGGGSASSGVGGAGGGLIVLTSTRTTTINGTIAANAGVATGGIGAAPGGGAGGAIKIIAEAVSGTPQAITINGGNAISTGGGGGGGCFYLGYYVASTISGSEVTKTGGSGAQSGGSGAAVVASLNSVPAISSLTASQSNSSGHVAVAVSVNDVNTNTLRLKTEYKLGSCSYTGQSTSTILSGSISATYASSSIALNNATTTGFQLNSISTLSGTNTVQFTWDTAADIPTANGSYCLFVTADDSHGVTIASTTVTIDNIAPTAPGNLSSIATTTQSITFQFSTTSIETNFLEYKIYYKAGASNVTTADTAFTSSTDSNLGSITYGGATTTVLSGLATSTQYVARLFAFDQYGHSASSSQEITLYTLAATPGVPSVSASTTATSSVIVVVNPASNPAAVTYAVCATNNGSSCASNGYVQADGSLGASAVWQTFTNWGGADGIVVTGLSSNTSYRFLVQAKNGDGIATSLSSANTAAHTLANPVSEFAVNSAFTTSTLNFTLSWTSANQTGLKIERDTDCDGSYDATFYDDASTNASSPTTTAAMSANTCYQFRIKSYNGSGVLNSFVFGTSSQITTPPAQPQNVLGSSVSTSSVTWSWGAVTGTASYYVYNGTTNALLTTTASTNHTESSLSSNTTYQLLVRPYNSNGLGLGSVVVATTTAALAPTGLAAATSTITTSSIRWVWSFAGQSAYYAQNKNNTAVNSGWITDTSTAYWTQTSLSANTSSTVQVKARNSNGLETSYTELAAYTRQNNPTSVSLGSIATSSITATVIGTFPNLGVASSVLQFSLSSGASFDSTTTTWTPSGLTPSTYYTFTVYATNGDGEVTSSTQASTYTLAAAPTFQNSTAGATSMLVSWATNGNGDGVEYYLENVSDGTMNSGWITGSSYRFSSLDPLTNYIFSLKARNGNGVETSFSTSSFTTVGRPGGFSASLVAASPAASNAVEAPSQPKNTTPIEQPVIPPPISNQPTEATRPEIVDPGREKTQQSAPVPAVIIEPKQQTNNTATDVTKTQQWLKERGYFTYPKVTGYFGSFTKAAVMRYQKAIGLKQTGTMDRATIEAMNAVLPMIKKPICRRAENNDVVTLQRKLIEEKVFNHLPTGYYGTLTEKAVREFQKRHALPVTGCVDQETRNTLEADS